MILVVAVCVNNCPAVRNISLKYRLRYLMLDRWKIVAGILRLNSSILWFIFFIFGCRYVAWFPAKLRLCFFKCWCCVLCQSPRRQLQLVSSGNFSSSYLADGDVVGFIRNKASFHPSCAVPVRYYSHLWTYFLLPARCELVVSADCPQMNCYANPGFFSVSSAPFVIPSVSKKCFTRLQSIAEMVRAKAASSLWLFQQRGAGFSDTQLFLCTVRGSNRCWCFFLKINLSFKHL